MKKPDSYELNKKVQETNLIYLVVISAIFLLFWRTVMPSDTIYIAIILVICAFLLYFQVLKPRMESLIIDIGKEKQ